MRVVSLIASSTEIVCALGFESLLVGRSHECDYPLSTHKLPVCTEIKFAADGTSYEIDQRIKAILQEGLSVYRVFAEKLKELRPDVILTQIQCEVCAVSRKDVEEAVCEWIGTRPKIVSLNPNSLADIWNDIRLVAEALGDSRRGDVLVSKLKGRMAGVTRTTWKFASNPSVACIEWVDPLMAAGNWVPELVEQAGGINLFGEAGKHSPWMTWDELVAKNPEVIVVMPCGFDMDRTQREMPTLEKKPGWGELRAVQSGRVYLADGNQYFNRPGPRVAESLEILAEIMHPEHLKIGFEGKGFRQYSASSLSGN